MSLSAQNPPHIRTRETNTTLMSDALIALLPLYAMATYFYGGRAIALGLTGLLTAVFTDFICTVIARRVPNLRDFSPAVTGMILPLLMPASVRSSIVIVAVVFAIVVAKHPFGGVGENIFNPAAAGMAFAIVCWPREVFTYPAPFEKLPLRLAADAAIRTGTSPAQALALGGVPNQTLLDLLMGNVPGPMGAANILVLLTCLLYLIVRRTVHGTATLAFLAGAAATAALFPRTGGVLGFSVLYELMSGMLLFAAVFMLNDPVTSPKRFAPLVVYGAMTGVLSIVFRHLGHYEESVIFALLVMNSAVWLLDLWGERLARRERRKEADDAQTDPGLPQETGVHLGDPEK